MAGGRTARGSGRGGDGIQATRPHRARLTTAAAAIALAVAVLAYPALAADGVDRLVALAGAVGVALLAVGLWRGAPEALPWALAALGAEYGAWLSLAGRDVDSRAPLVAAALVVVAELAYWSLELRGEAAPEVDVVLKRVLGVLGVAALAIAAGAAVLGISTIPAGSSVVLELVGVVGAVGLMALLARLAWRARDVPRP